MKYLILIDMEGIHGVVGVPMKGLTADLEEYTLATKNGVLEVNSAIKALYDFGNATEVMIWDNHAGKTNLDFSKVDPRAKQLMVDYSKPRVQFLEDYSFDAAIFLGYHAKEGSNGVLAHTYNSSENQYLKINGKQVGEFDFDARFIGEYGIPALFFASDDVAISQIKESIPDITTVVTKYAIDRNSANLRKSVDVINDIYNGVKLAVTKKIKPITFTFPCEFEIRYTRMEKAKAKYESVKPFISSLEYGEDIHVLKMTANSSRDIKYFC